MGAARYTIGDWRAVGEALAAGRWHAARGVAPLLRAGMRRPAGAGCQFGRDMNDCRVVSVAQRASGGRKRRLLHAESFISRPNCHIRLWGSVVIV